MTQRFPDVALRVVGGFKRATPVWFKGGLAVVPAVTTDGRGWSLSHCATGLQVARFGSRKNAIGCARRIVSLLNWSLAAPTRSATAAAREAITLNLALFEGIRMGP